MSAGPVSKFSIVTNKKAFSKDYMLGSAIPTFSLSFFDEAGNKSSAFCLPERLDDEVSPDDSLNLDDDECSPHCSYWVRVSSQHDGMEVLDNANEDYDDNSAPYAVHEIPKVCSSSFIIAWGKIAIFSLFTELLLFYRLTM